jgi:hypothetical protein
VYESFDTLCIYLESDALVGDPERNFWVKYRCVCGRAVFYVMALSLLQPNG